MMSQQVSQDPHPAVAGVWFHGRSASEMVFDEDRPAFFSCEREGVEMFAGREGFVLEAELLSVSPCRENHLMEIAAELGLPDVFSEDFTDFPDVSTYLEDPQVRRKLEERGFDSYVGEDGYLYVAVVWNPGLIRKLTVSPIKEAEPSFPTRPR